MNNLKHRELADGAKIMNDGLSERRELNEARPDGEPARRRGLRREMDGEREGDINVF